MPIPSSFRTSQLEENDGPGRNSSDNATMGDLIAARFSRRRFLQGSLAISAISATIGSAALLEAGEARGDEASGSAFAFDEVEAGVDATHHVADGYDADILLRWGDALFADSPAFDPANQTPESQARQFGYNNDYVGYIPIDGSPEHGLLVVNHEYTNPHLMFPGLVEVVEKDGKKILEQKPLTRTQVEIEMAAHGGTIVEIRKEAGKWRTVREGALNRRITASTPMVLTGPAAGHERLKTTADPSGNRGDRTLNNCAGASRLGAPTSWRKKTSTATFMGTLPEGHREAANYERLGVPEARTNGGARSALRPLEGAERAEPLRLDRGSRRERSAVAAEEAHGARPLQA